MKNLKNPKRIIIFAGVILVIIGISIATALILSQQKSSNSPQEGASEQKPAKLERKPSEKKADSADKLALEGDVEGGVKELDDAIKNTDDNSDKFIYYSRKATLLYNHGDLNGALSAAISAYQLEETSDSAAFVGQIARDKGDIATARDYYQKAITHINPDSPFADEDKKYYESIIAEMGAQ